MNVSRRALLGAGAAGLAAAALGLPRPLPWKPGKIAKNVILCVSDGMNLSVLTMADHLSRLRGGPGSYWGRLTAADYAVTGIQSTASLSSLVTDSAAAGSAWGSGRRVWNGMINEYPDGTRLKTVGEIAKENGMRLGMATTATVTHATPASFAVTTHQRDLEGLIAERYLELGVDVLLGGGDRFFAAEKRPDRVDLYAKFRAAGYGVARTKEELEALTDGRVLGVFWDGHLPYALDHLNQPGLVERVPTLAEMARTAIARLKGGGEGFFLQVEGARIDHAGHANDLAAIVHDQVAFEEAVEAVVEFALQDGETLVVVTTDHGCGGPNLNGAGQEYGESNAGFGLIAGMKASYGPVFEAIGREPDAAAVQGVVEDRLGVRLTGAEAEAVARAVRGGRPFELLGNLSGSSGALGVALGNHTKVSWTSAHHNSDDVVVTALGPGSERFAGMLDNTAVFDAMISARGLAHENPRMTYEDAARHMERSRARHDPELTALYGSGEGIEGVV